jgi:hypothetical protein
MNLQENYRRLFKGRLSSNDSTLLKEASSIPNDPILKKYGFDRTDSPDTLKGKLATRANLKGVTTVAYFDNSKWNLPAEPFSRNKIRNKIHTTLEKTLSKHIGGKLKSIWGSFNADLPDNITALAMSGGNATSITIDQGNVSGMDREVTGTYNGKSFELETSDGMTSIYLNGKSVDDEDDVYDDILNAVNDQGYELQENYKRLFKSRVNSNDQKLLKEAYFPVHGADSPDVKKAKAALANWFMNISRNPGTPSGARAGTLNKRTLDILHDLIDDYALAYAEDEIAAAEKVMSRKF